MRYLRRSWFERHRVGALDGNQDSIKWSMIKYIAMTTRANRQKYEANFPAITLPKIRLATPRALARFYQREQLTCP